MNQVSNSVSASQGQAPSLADCLAILFMVGLALATPLAQAGHPSSVPKPSALTFNVWLDDREMGTHHYYFEESDGMLRVTSEADFSVKVVFVTVFSYQHKATETWSGNCLRALTSNTTTNGKVEEIDVDFPASDCLGTYTYWDKQRLRRPQLLNAQTAETEQAVWKNLETKRLPTIGKRKKIRQQPAVISAVELSTPSAQFRLYYNAQDELLMMQTDNDGRTITYLRDTLVAK